MAPAQKTGTARSSSVIGAEGATVAKDSTSSQTHASTNDAKRLKKRETDRRCQREARQRTKFRIAYLEGLVEQLRRKDTSGQVASLMHQLSETRKERDAYAKTLKTIEESVKGCWAGSSSTASASLASPRGAPYDQRDKSPSTQPIEVPAWLAPPTIAPHAAELLAAVTETPDQNEVIEQGQVDLAKAFNDQDMPMYQNCCTTGVKTCDTTITRASMAPDLDLLDGANLDRPLASQSFPSSTSESLMIPPTPVPFLHCVRCDPLGPPNPSYPNVWAFAHSVIGPAPCSLSFAELAWEDRVSGDLPVRALAEGWHAAERSVGGKLPPLWGKLRQIDETVFGDIGKVERLAILLVMHLLLRYHADGSEYARRNMPAWYLARPSQNITHSYALDFFTWPGIRERFVLRPHQYCTNVFWRAHNRNLRILWPESFSACYSQDPSTGLYNVAANFERRISDIKAWTMTSDFFSKFPELLGDIVAYNNPGRTYIPGDTQAMYKTRAIFQSHHNTKEHEGDPGDAESSHYLGGSRANLDADVLGIRETEVLPEHDLLWFQGALATADNH